MENRNGLVFGALATRASGHAERLAALRLVGPHAERAAERARVGSWMEPAKAVTLGADKGYDARDFVADLRDIAVTPHVSQNVAQNVGGRRPAIDDRTATDSGYGVSLRIRKRIEEAFGWAKTVAGPQKARHRGLPKVDWQFTFAMAAYNLVRLPKLLAVAA